VKRLRILVVDDQAMFREGVLTLLSLEPDFDIVGEAADGVQAVAEAAALRPDIILMDLRLPRQSGIDATREIMAAAPATRIIMLTTFEEDAEVFAALRAGAVGYLLKASPIAKVCEAIRQTARGGSLLEPSVAAKVLGAFARQPPPPARDGRGGPAEALSEAETRVLRLLGEGMSNKEIAAALGLAEGTVKNRMSRIFEKLGVLDRTQAALRAREFGLV
jgi:DNA-binding NarL/FixJ family response regulator